MWHSLRQKCPDIHSNMSLGIISHAIQMCCFSFAIVCRVWWYTKSFRYSQRKKSQASSLANKEAMSCHFPYACRNPRQLPAHWNVHLRNQILQTSMWMTIILHEPGGIQTVLQSSMNPQKFFQNPKIMYSIYQLLLKKWSYYSFEGNHSSYH